VSALARHWSFDPMVVVLAFTALAHELGLARLAHRSTLANAQRRRRRSLLFYGALVVLVLTIASPLDYWANDYFYVHMIEHILLMFAVPMLVVLGAPWTPLLFALPVGARRRLGRFVYLSPRARVLRALGRVARSPWVAWGSFNAAMLVWHIPSWFELAERNQAVHVWLMHGSFLVTGVLFWLQFLPSSPMKPKTGPLWQVGALLSTNAIMTMLAISMSILTTVSWYPSYSHLRGVTLSPFADQQIGAAILWVCGDFWALPVLGMVIRRAMDQQGSLAGAIDRAIGRSTAPSYFRGVATGVVPVAGEVERPGP
jgi:putative copper resistance protein D